ncbi:MAG: hypothetical protein JWQ44_2522 [Chthoniobacter sp.]|nr:hypothetical protein [Chthoniobacter sp.]
MNSGDRYAALLALPLREEPLIEAPRHFTELELQAHWFAGDFGRDFVTADGLSVRIVQFGRWNREAGPDFAEAAVAFAGGEPVRGSIELDPQALDWERHGHGANPHYDSVVLHVVFESSRDEFFTRTSEHRHVPQVRIDPTILGAAPALAQPEAKPGRCVAPLAALPEEKVREVLFGAAEFRLRRKAAALSRLSELHGSDEALFQALAATLGYKSNKLPFTLLAQRLPLKFLRKTDAHALLFGVSGFLPAMDLGEFDTPTRTYLRGLWETWWARRAELQRLTLDRELWSFAGQRPANHPQRRLAALAEMIGQWPKIRALSKRTDPRAIQEFFGGLHHEYWDLHYTVSSKPAARPMALVGESRVTEMLTNVFLPLAYARKDPRWESFRELPASLSNRRVEIAALRLFGGRDLGRTLLRSAAMQQGLLQVYEDFCMRDASDCERCAFPTQLAKW